jgi:P-type E1-E2 ATPase
MKLDVLAAILTKIGLLASFAILAASLQNYLIRLIFFDMKGDQIVNELCQYVTQFVTIIIVAVPEGLPLAITLSLACSVNRMKDDGILLKDLDTPEIMANVNQVLVGKTGTLTTADLKVSKFYVQSKVIQNKRSNTLFNTDLKDEVVSLI